MGSPSNSISTLAATTDMSTNTSTIINTNMNMKMKTKKHSSQTRTAMYLTLATLALIAVTTITVHTMPYITGHDFHNLHNYNSHELSHDKYDNSMTSHQHNPHNPQSLRSLEEDENGDDGDGNNDDEYDYSDQICDDIFTLTEVNTQERCSFAKTCNSNQGLQLSFIFCDTYNLSTLAWIAILSPILIVWLVVLFRMLGSTAEDFFSPSLEMFSMKLGLPPRFAGVTLLALGNGAADVSATMNAIVQNPAEGYQMALGALTGAGMFVGTVVAGIVIVYAEGVKCRGALVRDLLMFIITLGVVYSFLKTGMIGPAAVHTFLWMYAGFVLIVLIADVYHRAVVLPRMRKLEENSIMEEMQNNYEETVDDTDNSKSDDSRDGTTAESNDLLTGEENETSHQKKVTFGDGNGIGVNESFGGEGDVQLVATSNNDNVDTSNDLHSSALTAAQFSTDGSGEADDGTNFNLNNSSLNQAAEENFADNPDNSDALASTDGEAATAATKKSKNKLKFKKLWKKKKHKKTYAEKQQEKEAQKEAQVQEKPKISKVQQGVDTIMTALSNYASDEGNPNTQESFKGWSEGLEVTSSSADKPVRLHGTNGILSKTSVDEVLVEDEENNDGSGMNRASASYRVLLENVDNLCTVDGSTSSGMNIDWGNSIVTGWHELIEHFTDYYNGIFTNEENNWFEKFFLLVELPFTVLRKLTISIPCHDYYCRGLVAVSFALSPLWFGIYCILERGSNLFFTGGFPMIEIVSIFSVLIAIFIVKFAPAEERDLSLAVSVPIAFVGFVIAATWIDTIADQLVRLLTLLGVICRIPGSIMGLTVLAWGNSMGDLSANMTMAKKGLANMAITACFAGPVFNILIGLGGGFAKLNSKVGQDYAEVELSPPISVGFIFLLCNCILVLLGGLVWNRGQIPVGYGYIALALYGFYVVISVWLQFQYNE